jgi:hypothetical protein
VGKTQLETARGNINLEIALKGMWETVTEVLALDNEP